jgi:hypothetical protein
MFHAGLLKRYLTSSASSYRNRQSRDFLICRAERKLLNVVKNVIGNFQEKQNGLMHRFNGHKMKGCQFQIIW